MEYAFSLLPVLIFLMGLYLFDSFKLVNKKIILLCLLWGIMAAFLSYHLNTYLMRIFSADFNSFSQYIAPLSEELIKSLIVIFLVFRKNAGFLIDAAIYGFATGAGFALAENVFYLQNTFIESNMLVWILRGLGTALMHGGSTALLAMILMAGIQRDKNLLLSIIPALITAYLLHSSFNHFLISPLLQTALLLVILPLLFMIVFRKSNLLMQDWLEIEFSSEIDMLKMIRQGNFLQTKAGNYLASLKNYFNPEMLLDLYCYISIYLDLSIIAKRNMMLRENDLEIIPDPSVAEKLIELKQLRKRIGKAGEMALQPVVRIKHRELWKLGQLEGSW